MRAGHRILWTTLLAAGIAAAAESPSFSPPPEADPDETQRLEREVLALRQELAATKLELRQALRELRDIREFLASDDALADVERWRRERQDLASERSRLQAQRRAMEDERRRLQRAIIADQPPPGPAPVPEPPPPPRPDYELDYKLAYVRTAAGGRPTYVEFGDLLVPTDSPPDIDRDHVMIRGTLQNRSKAAWRYTFEVRLADRGGNIIGRWRYQTPVLSPNELHPFDIDVPVTDALSIDRYQIGNIEADQPRPARP